MASGSIAQIHKAKLTVAGAAGGAFEPGKVVAVKVGHRWESLPVDPAAPAWEAIMQAAAVLFQVMPAVTSGGDWPTHRKASGWAHEGLGPSAAGPWERESWGGCRHVIWP